MKLYLIKKQILISLIITAAAIFIGSQVLDEAYLLEDGQCKAHRQH